MSYIELGNTMFRGTLSAATGEVQFDLEAGAIDAVDTINIAHGAVSYSQYFDFTREAVKDQVFFSVNANIKDGEAFLEVTTFSNMLGRVYVGGVEQNRHNAIANVDALPVVVVVPLSLGVHPVELSASASGTASGWLNLRYIRYTGVNR